MKLVTLKITVLLNDDAIPSDWMPQSIEENFEENEEIISFEVIANQQYLT